MCQTSWARPLQDRIPKVWKIAVNILTSFRIEWLQNIVPQSQVIIRGKACPFLKWQPCSSELLLCARSIDGKAKRGSRLWLGRKASANTLMPTSNPFIEHHGRPELVTLLVRIQLLTGSSINARNWPMFSGCNLTHGTSWSCEPLDTGMAETSGLAPYRSNRVFDFTPVKSP